MRSIRLVWISLTVSSGIALVLAHFYEKVISPDQRGYYYGQVPMCEKCSRVLYFPDTIFHVLSSHSSLTISKCSPSSGYFPYEKVTAKLPHFSLTISKCSPSSAYFPYEKVTAELHPFPLRVQNAPLAQPISPMRK